MTVERVAQSLRLLKRHKRFSAMAVACLALAISLNTTMYSVLDALISPRTEVHEPHRIVSVAVFGFKAIPLEDKLAAINSLSFSAGGTSWYGSDDFIAERGTHIRAVYVQTVMPSYFTVMGVRPKAGRLLVAEDLGDDSQPVVIGERLWEQLFPDQKRFEPAVIHLQGKLRRVIGMLPSSAFGVGGPDIWELEGSESRWYGFRWFPSVVRLKPGVTVEQANAELNALSQRYRQITTEGTEAGWVIRPLMRREYHDWNFQYALIGSVVAVLLIACANLANLQLARGVSRARELATRVAVGASRSDVVTQLVLESAWLALGGLLLGSVMTYWGIELIEHYIPRSVVQYMGYPQASWRVFAVAIGATLLCVVLVGLLPAIRLSRVNVNELLKSGTGTGKTKSARRQYGALVITEVALALALLCSTGLLVKSAVQVLRSDLNTEFAGIVYSGARVAPERPGDKRNQREWSSVLIRQALATDSVTRAATRTDGCPTREAISVYDEGGHPINFFAPRYCYSFVSSEYFRVIRRRIVEGRNFTTDGTEPEVIVDVVAARTLWKTANPIGQHIKLDSSHVRAPWYRVVGVVQPAPRRFDRRPDDEDLDLNAPNSRDRINYNGPMFAGQVYVLNAADTASVLPVTRADQPGGAYIYLVADSRGDRRLLPLRLHTKLAELGPNVTPAYPRTWGQTNLFDALRDKHTFMATLFGIFAFSALVLAALGVYAIIAHMVAQRTREFGVRIAVGAGDRDIRRMVLREGNVLTLAGIAVGLLITWEFARYVRAFVFSDWDRYDSRVFAVVAVLLFIVAWVASYLPARRAMRINPVEALRND